MDLPPAAATEGRPRRMAPAVTLQFVILLEIGLRLLIWAAPLAAVLWVAGAFELAADFQRERLVTWRGAARAASTTTELLLLYNVLYLLELVVLRLLVPTPRAGRYSLATSRPDANLLYSCLAAILTKARYQPPFPAVFVSQLANIAPFRWLLGWRFGPHSRSVFFVEAHILDPWGVHIGRNVTLGFGSCIAAHVQEHDHVLFAPVTIEDDVVVGAFSSVAAGAHIKRGAVIRPYSFVLPFTVIGEGEYWGGIPARRTRDVKPTAIAERAEAPPVRRPAGGGGAAVPPVPQT